MLVRKAEKALMISNLALLLVVFRVTARQAWQLKLCGREATSDLQVSREITPLFLPQSIHVQVVQFSTKNTPKEKTTYAEASILKKLCQIRVESMNSCSSIETSHSTLLANGKHFGEDRLGP